MSTFAPNVVAKPLFGGLKRAKIHLLPYDLGERGGRILVRVLYWTYYDHTREEKGWRAVLYDDAGKIVRESEYAASEAEALQDVLHRFVRLRDAPYLFLYDLFEVFASGGTSTLRFTVYKSKRVCKQPRKSPKRFRESGIGKDIDQEELRGQKIPRSHRYARLDASRLIGLLSEHRLMDLFHRGEWSMGERPGWFAGIRFSTTEEDRRGVDLWVSSNDGLPDIPIQVTSSEAMRLWKFDHQMGDFGDEPPVIVAGRSASDKYVFEQLMQACEICRYHLSQHPFRKTA